MSSTKGTNARIADETAKAALDVEVSVRTATRRIADVFAEEKDVVRTLALRGSTPEARMLRVAAAQFDPVLGDAGHNADRICALIEQSANNGAQLVVFPEGAITGYNAADLGDARAVALPDASLTASAIAETCARTGTVAVVGAVRHAADGSLRNSAFIIGPGGVIAIYDKAHLPAFGADRFVAAGQTPFAPIELPFARIGVLIGYDADFPEAARALALRGAEILALPAAWPVGAESGVEFIVKSRAFENRVFVIASNRVGAERGAHYIGRSCIAAPVGVYLAEASTREEHIIIADINLNEAAHKRLILQPGEFEMDLFGDRRPDLYGV